MRIPRPAPASAIERGTNADFAVDLAQAAWLPEGFCNSPFVLDRAKVAWGNAVEIVRSPAGAAPQFPAGLGDAPPDGNVDRAGLNLFLEIRRACAEADNYAETPHGSPHFLHSQVGQHTHLKR